VVRLLTAADQRRLVHALLELDGMRQSGTREIYISALERELGYHLPVIRHDQAIFDVWQLVDTCLSYPGAIRTLIAVVETFHGGSRPMMAIRELADELFVEPLLAAEERRELHMLLKALDRGRTAPPQPPVLAALYREAVGPVGPMLEPGDDDIFAVLARLEEAAADADGVPPLLRFVERIATYADDGTAGALRDWVERFATAHRVGGEHLHRIREGTVHALGPGGAPVYLIIELAPDGADPESFLLTAWVQYGTEPGVPLSRDDEPLPLSKVPACITALLTEHPQVVNRSTPSLRIEFVLPRPLLGHPVDQWRITMDELERRLGIEHPVVVRSLDRMRRAAWHHNWRRKWAWLKKNPEAPGSHWLDVAGRTGGEQLYNALLLEESSVCLVMGFTPSPSWPSVADELWIALQAGVPVIAWCRDAGVRAPEGFVEEFRKLLAQGALRLPDSVLPLRRRAVQAHRPDVADAHLGSNLTLVFDDADRVPEPYFPLTSPS
jgi:hypothetical protein